MESVSDNSVNQQQIDIKQASSLVFMALKKSKTKQTLADIQVSTGLEIYKTEEAVNLLMKEYNCTLDVNEKGQIVYDFQLNKPRSPSVWQKYLINLLDFLLHLLLFLAKLVITVVFFSYALTLGVIVAVLATALVKSPQPIAFLFFALFESAKLLFVDIQSFFDKKKRKNVGLNSKNIVNSVFVYAFGYQPYIDEFAVEKRILSFIRSVNYKITAADLALITGWNYVKCNTELTLLLTNYSGKVYVTDEGVIVYYFPEFEGISESEPEKPESLFIWNNLVDEKAYEYRKRADFKFIKGVSVFSLIVSVLILSVNRMFYHLEWTDFWHVALFQSEELLGMSSNSALWTEISLYLFAFFVLIFLFSAISKARENALVLKIRYQNLVNQYLHQMLSYLPDVPAGLFQGFTEKQLFDFSLDYEGELKVDENDASLFYRFALIHEELQVAHRERGVSALKIEQSVPTEELKQKSSPLYQKAMVGKKVGKRRISVKELLIYLFIILLALFIALSGSIIAVVKTNFSKEFKESASLKVDHESPFYFLFKTEVYKNFGKLEILNASTLRPVPDLGKISLIKKLKIDGADKIILPTEMLKLEYLEISNVDGKLILPSKLASLLYLSIVNIQSDILLFNQERLYVDEFELKNIKGGIKIQFYSEQTKKLTISNCGLNDATVDSLKYFFGVKELDLSYNALTKIPEWLLSHEPLSKISLRGNSFTSIPTALFDFASLYQIDLAYNAIDNLPDSMNFSIITELDLTANRIHQLPASFWSYRIGEISLDSNLISQWPIPDTLTSISKISMAYNKISDFPVKKYLLGQLRALNLAHNQISKLDDSLALFKLQNLNVSYNQIEHLPGIIFNQSLSTFHIAHNPLKTASFEHKPALDVSFYIDKNQKPEVLAELKKWIGVQNLIYMP